VLRVNELGDALALLARGSVVTVLH